MMIDMEEEVPAQMDNRPEPSNEMDNHHNQLMSQYQQITVSSKVQEESQIIKDIQDTFTITPKQQRTGAAIPWIDTKQEVK